MRVDPAVRSLRIATVLNERFGAILREAKDPQTIAELEIKIGEAQQIYPEIWRHLDEARGALAARELSVARYDELRATEKPGQQAVGNIDHAEGINPLAFATGGALYGETKTATFNAEGHAKAHEACAALMQTLPDVDWRALELAEEAEIAAAGSLNASKWGSVIVLCVIALAVVIAFRMIAC